MCIYWEIHSSHWERPDLIYVLYMGMYNACIYIHIHVFAYIYIYVHTHTYNSYANTVYVRCNVTVKDVYNGTA